jgi:hypothetical protein
MSIAVERSRINSNALLDGNNWGVTVISTDGNAPDSHGHVPHQMIVLEGVNANGVYFRELGELTTDKGKDSLTKQFVSGTTGWTRHRVFNESINELDKRMFHKTNTLVLSKDKVQRLGNRLYEQNNKDYPYFFAGSKSIGASKAEVIPLYNEVLEAVQQVDKHLFMCLYDSAKKNNGLCTGMNRQEFDKRIEDAICL